MKSLPSHSDLRGWCDVACSLTGKFSIVAFGIEPRIGVFVHSWCPVWLDAVCGFVMGVVVSMRRGHIVTVLTGLLEAFGLV